MSDPQTPKKADSRSRLIEQLRQVQQHPAFRLLRDYIDENYDLMDYVFGDLTYVRQHADMAHLAGRKYELAELREIFKEAGLPKAEQKQG